MFHRVGDREDIRFVVFVIVVLEEVPDDARRRRGHELVCHRGALERGGEVFDVALDQRVAAPGDGTGTDRAFQVPRAEHPQLVELRKIRRFDLGTRGAAVAVESGEPLRDVGSVANFADFAVVDHVHVRVDLLADDFPDGVFDTLFERGVVAQLLLIVALDHGHQVIGPRQAARMRGEDAIGAALHQSGTHTMDDTSLNSRRAFWNVCPPSWLSYR